MRLPSPLLEENSVHGEAQDGADGGAEARPQPEGGVLEVGLGHVPAGGSRSGSAVGLDGRGTQMEEGGVEGKAGGQDKVLRLPMVKTL